MPNPPRECPKCGGSATSIAYEKTFKQVYPLWSESRILRQLDRTEATYACLNCGAIKE